MTQQTTTEQTPPESGQLFGEIHDDGKDFLFLLHCPKCQDVRRVGWDETQAKCGCKASGAVWVKATSLKTVIRTSGSARILAMATADLVKGSGVWFVLKNADFVERVQ